MTVEVFDDRRRLGLINYVCGSGAFRRRNIRGQSLLLPNLEGFENLQGFFVIGKVNSLNEPIWNCNLFLPTLLYDNNF